MGHVFLIDDDEALCKSMANVLRFARYQVQVWSRPEDFLAAVPEVSPAVLLTDMRMPGMDGLRLHAALNARGAQLPVVYMSGESSLADVVSAMKLGAMDFLPKPFQSDNLLEVVSTAMARARQQCLARAEQARLAAALASLSPRERQVHGLLIKGYSNKEIVDALGVSLPTAKQYKAEVMRKLGAASLSELIGQSRGSSN